jgi:hypothetical protein
MLVLSHKKVSEVLVSSKGELVYNKILKDIYRSPYEFRDVSFL